MLTPTIKSKKRIDRPAILNTLEKEKEGNEGGEN